MLVCIFNSIRVKHLENAPNCHVLDVFVETCEGRMHTVRPIDLMHSCVVTVVCESSATTPVANGEC